MENEFVDYCTISYKKLLSSEPELKDFSNVSVFEAFFNSISYDISASELRTKYRNGVYNTIDRLMPVYKKDVELLRSIKEMKYYENSISIYACFIIFWILEHEVQLSTKELNLLTESIYAATIGYRLLDLHQDHNLIGGEAIILGYRFINLYEELLLSVFPSSHAFSTIKKNSNNYCEVEYIEKSNRWKKCPFSWENVEVLANKAAPLFSIFELIFKHKNLSDDHILEIMDALKGLVACTQLNDDIIDAQDDLTNGFETLVMGGYYEKFGIEKDVTREKIDAYFNENKVKDFYNIQLKIFEKARKIFTRRAEYLLLLLMELQYYQFNKSILVNQF